MNYQSKVLAHELLIKKLAKRMDRLEETACECGDKRKGSQEEYKTPSPNLELTADKIRDHNETDWNKEDSPTPAQEPSKNREKKRPRIESISPKSTPEPAPRAKDKKTPDVELFDGNAAKFKEFVSKLETYFRMRPESYSRKDFNGKILYTSMRLTGSASNWWMANEKEFDTSMLGHWTSWTDFVEELRKSCISKKKLRRDALHLHVRLGAPYAHPTFHYSSVGALHLAFRPVRPQISPPASSTPCPHPHLPTRPTHHQTSTFLSSLCTISTSCWTR